MRIHDELKFASYSGGKDEMWEVIEPELSIPMSGGRRAIFRVPPHIARLIIGAATSDDKKKIAEMIGVTMES